MVYTILYIEHDRLYRSQLAQQLKKSGYLVHTAEHGADALVVLAKQRPDLILCAAQLPTMDGYALLDHLRHHRPEFAPVPFILLLDKYCTQPMRRKKSVAADAYLNKPLDLPL